MTFTHTNFAFAAVGALALGLAVPAAAQDINNPQIKAEFGTPTQGLRQAFKIDDGIRTKGRFQVGPTALRLQLNNGGKARLLMQGSSIQGAEVGAELSTRISVAVKPDGTLPTAEEIKTMAGQLSQKTVFSAGLAGELKVTRENAAGAVNARLGEGPQRVTHAGAVPLKINLGIATIKLIPAGALTEGGAHAAGMAVFDVNWKKAKLTMGLGAAIGLPKKLSGKGVAGGFIMEIQINKDFGKQLKAAWEITKEEIKKLVEKAATAIKRGSRKVKDVFTNYRGPTTKSDAKKIKPNAGAPFSANGLSDAEIAAKFAPVIYQRMKSRHDMLRKVDFDGDWNTKNNWDNSGKASADNTGAVYFSVKQTTTHAYITYALYYARRSGNKVTRHENDMAGVTVVVRKGAPLGKAIEMVIASSGSSAKFYTSNKKAWPTRELEKADGETTNAIRNGGVKFVDEESNPLVDRDRTHPQIWVKGKSHGVFAYNGRDDSNPFGKEKGVVYAPGKAVAAPTPSNNMVGYALLPMSELDKITTVKKDGRMKGDEGWPNNRAKLPKAWDINLPGVEKGDLVNDPAGTLAKLFKVGNGFGRTYLGGSATGAAGALTATGN